MDPLVGRDEEIDRAIQILARRSKMPGSDTCEPRINKPWFINWGGIPPIVMIYMIWYFFLWYLPNSTAVWGLLIQGWHYLWYGPGVFPWVFLQWGIPGLVNIQKAIENGHRNRYLCIVDLPINSMVIFHSYVKVYQRVVGITSTKQDPVGRLGFPNGIFAWPRIWHWEWPTFVAPLFRFAHSIWPKKWSSKSKKGIRPLRGLALMDSIKLQFHHVSFSFRATLITPPVYQSED